MLGNKVTNQESLRAGSGAEGKVLTKMIKPTQPNINPKSKHQSNVVILDYLQENESTFYKMCFREDHESGNEDFTLLTANKHFVKITKEGDPSLLFSIENSNKKAATIKRTKKTKTKKEKHIEPDISWQHSKAKKLLYMDIKKGRIPATAKDSNGKRTMPLKQIYDL